MRIGVALILLLGAGLVRACPDTPFNETWTNQASAAWETGSEGCRLALGFAANADDTASASAHFRRRPGAGPLRLRLRYPAQLPDALGPLGSVTLASGVTGRHPDGATHPVAFRASLFRLSTPTSVSLALVAGCSNGAGDQCSISVGALAPGTVFDREIGIELAFGAGTGSLRYWLHRDFDGPPTGEINGLDNLAWQDLHRLSIGAMNAGSSVRTAFSTAPLVLDRIRIDDDQLAWHDFEGEDSGQCQVEPQPVVIGGNGGVISGTTCGGGQALAVLASGSTWAPAPERIHRLEVLGVGANGDDRPLSVAVASPQVPGMAAYLCSASCGPAAACIEASSGSALSATVPAGTYHLVLKPVGAPASACGSYSANITTVLK